MLAVVSVLVFEFILQPMCRSLKKSTYAAVKYLPSFAANHKPLMCRIS